MHKPKPTTKEDKIRMLNAILKDGKSYKEVLPTVDVSFIETEPDKYYSPELRSTVEQGDLALCIEGLKHQYKGHIINITQIHYPEFKRIEQELEFEY